jgi:hypothetical protein
MGFMDTMFGKSPELKFEQSPQQAEMYKTMFPNAGQLPFHL